MKRIPVGKRWILPIFAICGSAFPGQIVPEENHLQHIPYMVLSSTHIITGKIIGESDTSIDMGPYTHQYTEKKVLVSERPFGSGKLPNPIGVSFPSGGVEDSLKMGKSYTFFLKCDSSRCHAGNFKETSGGMTLFESILFDTSALNCETRANSEGYPPRRFLTREQLRLVPFASKDLSSISNSLAKHFEIAFKWVGKPNTIGSTAFLRKPSILGKSEKAKPLIRIAEKMVFICEKEFQAMKERLENNGPPKDADCREFQ